MTERICLWSGPRNVSTAIMYSFSRRPDTTVVDEPLYAHYLHTSGARHPGRDEVLADQENDGGKVIQSVVLGDYQTPVVFFKHMAHHLHQLDWSFLKRTVNVILVRDPQQMLPSLINQIPRPVLADTGLDLQSRLWTFLDRIGQPPPVIDARELLLDPRSVLTRLCEHIGLSFDERQLSWPQGALASDGIWAKHWYHNIHRSTGFQPYSAKVEPFPKFLLPLLEECRPHYQFLQAKALRAANP